MLHFFTEPLCAVTFIVSLNVSCGSYYCVVWYCYTRVIVFACYMSVLIKLARLVQLLTSIAHHS